VLACVLFLHLDRPAVHIRRASVGLGLGLVRPGHLRICGVLRPALRRASVRRGASLPFARKVLASAGGLDVIPVGHTCKVPAVAEHNQPAAETGNDGSWLLQREYPLSKPGPGCGDMCQPEISTRWRASDCR